MALGVLNNLSAIYAENNLNRTSNSLQNVLRQLSSGSRINSGADDAAGLSLINGLQANSSALTQSKTNATEGVGLLEVADGALSQVTSLLNRAITLATEASNGTLNPTQEAAANQEYQSIMGEINNIGSTTTYNQQTVFSGHTISIYTGDSSTTGSSIDNLNIRTLSAASVGDTNGVMSYTDGRNNVFLNLSSSTTNAELTDVLNPAGSTTIDVNYLVKGAIGGSSTASTQIMVGAGTTYSNTVNGLISAINNAGLGLTASFTTQAKAGVTGGGMQTGIQIAGGLVSAGVDPSSASTAGTLNPDGIPANQLLTQGQTITIKQGGSAVGSPITITPTLNTLDEVAKYINTPSNGYSNAVKASVVTNGDGTQSLSLENATSSGGALTVTTAAGVGAVVPALSSPALVAKDPPFLATTLGSPVTGITTVPPVNGSYTFGVNGTNAALDNLSDDGSITLSNTLAGGTLSATFIVGSGSNAAVPGVYYTKNTDAGGTNNPSTLAGLAATIQASGLGVTASVDSGGAGIVVKSTTAANGDNIALTGLNTITNANNVLGLYAPSMGGAASAGSPTVTELSAGVSSLHDTILGAINLSNGNSADDFTFTASGADTYADLALAINGSNLGVTASWDAANNGLKLTSTASGAPAITVAAGSTMVDVTLASANVAVNAGASSVGTFGTPATASTAVLQIANGTNMVDASANLTGQFTLNYNSKSQVFIMGAPPAVPVAGAIYTGAYTVNSLVTSINSAPAAALGVSAALPGTGVGDSGGIYIQGTPGVSSQITLSLGSTLASAVSATTTTIAPGVTSVTGLAAIKTVGLAPSVIGSIGTSDVLADGSITLSNAGGASWTFTIGTGNAANTTYLAAGSTVADLASKITTTNTTTGLGLTALASTSGLTFTQNVPSGANGGGITVASTLTDATLGSYSTTTLGPFASETDTVSGTMSFAVGSGSPQSVTVASGSTVDGMIARINLNSAALGVTAKWVGTSNGFGNVVLTSNAEGSAGQLATLTTSIVDTTPTANLSYAAAGAYDIALSSDSGSVVFDSTSGQDGNNGAATFVSNAKSGSGAAVTSYSDSAGVSLAGTSLLSQSAAQSALSSLNLAISDVASMDGYIGAQINMLNSISQVMSTQQENLTSAQNAIQATDYASATADMSKYEILSQTGIAALAQANSVQREVTKLLQ